MSSYFDHFLLISIYNILSDSFFILTSILILILVIKNNFFLVSNKKKIIVDSIISHWTLLINQNLNEENMKFIYPFFSLFFFLVLINLCGFFLFTFPITTHLNITLSLAFIVWFYIFCIGVIIYKAEFFSMFMPRGSPLILSPLLVIIEIVSYISRPIALGMRLAANLTAGHILLAILSDFSCKLILLKMDLLSLFPILIIVFMTILELGVLFIQAYVFVLLSVVYLRDSLILH